MSPEKGMEIIMEFAADEMRDVLEKHGEETLLKSIDVINTMSRAVKTKYGECPEIMLAIDIMYGALTKIREKVERGEPLYTK